MELVARAYEQQKLIARNLVAELHPLWEILDIHDINRTTAPWLKAVRPAIERARLTSQLAAVEFVRNYRAAVLPVAEPLEVQLPQDPELAIRIMVAMKVTGPDWLIKHSLPGDLFDPQDLMARGFSKSSGAATRLCLNGGRTSSLSLIRQDPRARGVLQVSGAEARDHGEFLKLVPIPKDDDSPGRGYDFDTRMVCPVYASPTIVGGTQQ